MREGDLATHQTQVRAAFEALDRARQAAAESVRFDETFAQTRKLHDGLMAAPKAADPQATFDAHDEYTDHLLELAHAVANASGLALDPDLDTYHPLLSKTGEPGHRARYLTRV
jgi:hypothetical protein